MDQGQTFLTSIRSGPHWRVNIRPLKFERTLTGSLENTRNTVERARVRLRGWDYPHIDPENRWWNSEYDSNWVESGHHREYWRFYRSGQFIHLFAFWEDGYNDQARRTAEIQGVFAEGGLKSSNFLGIISTVYLMTEICQFAASLAGGTGYADGVLISIKLQKVKGRLLYLGGESSRTFSGCYPASDESIIWDGPHAQGELLGKTNSIAVDACEYIFSGFGWHPENIRAFIAHEQEKLLAGQFD